MKRMRLWLALSALPVAACGAGQAGEDYQGEPLMSLNGVVASTSAALDEGLVPALLMRESIFTITPSSPGKAYFIQGEVEGSFPNAFTLRVYQPPPAETLDVLFEGEPAFGAATITAVSPDHPAWLRTESFTEVTEDGEVAGERICSEDECLSGLLTCPDGQGDPSLPWPCGATFPDEQPWETYGYVVSRTVLYLDGPAAAGSVLAHMYNDDQALDAGYHVVELIEPTQAQLDEQTACTTRADQLALEEANQINGTSWTQWQLDTPEHVRQRSQLGQQHTAAEGCDTFMRVVESTAEAPVELQFLDDPTLTGFLL